MAPRHQAQQTNCHIVPTLSASGDSWIICQSFDASKQSAPASTILMTFTVWAEMVHQFTVLYNQINFHQFWSCPAFVSTKQSSDHLRFDFFPMLAERLAPRVIDKIPPFLPSLIVEKWMNGLIWFDYLVYTLECPGSVVGAMIAWTGTSTSETWTTSYNFQA